MGSGDGRKLCSEELCGENANAGMIFREGVST